MTEIGEHLALVCVAAFAMVLGAIGLSKGVDGVLLGGIVAVLASIAGFIAGRTVAAPEA